MICGSLKTNFACAAKSACDNTLPSSLRALCTRKKYGMISFAATSRIKSCNKFIDFIAAFGKMTGTQF